MPHTDSPSFYDSPGEFIRLVIAMYIFIRWFMFTRMLNQIVNY